MTAMPVSEDDTLTFLNEEPTTPALPSADWKILVVDDDEEVHRVTCWVLADYRFAGRGLTFIGARSRSEAQAALHAHPDIAIVLLDVVMEEDDAGLKLVRFIRDELRNTHVRIVLRTGQPGQAPEHEVITNYDINDYKAKTELTTQKLFTTVTTALRNYRDIMTIETSRRGLEQILEASSSLFERRSMAHFISGVVLQIQSLLRNDRGAILCGVRANADGPEDYEIVAAAGPYAEKIGAAVADVLPPHIVEDIAEAYRRKANVYDRNHCAIFFQTHNYTATVVYVYGNDPLAEVDRQLIEVFCSKVAIGFDNVFLFEQLTGAQKAIVHSLARLAEYRDHETGEHVGRVETLSLDIALRLQASGVFPALTHELIDYLGLASILHDVGKVAIPDAILLKPGPLSAEERAIIEKHSTIGSGILGEASQMVQGISYLQVAAEIAGSHHEKFNGTGYPHGLKGDDIPLSGRIVAVADVFDALTSARPYKQPWSVEQAIAHIRDQSGRHFDPRVVDAFLEIMAAKGLDT